MQNHLQQGHLSASAPDAAEPKVSGLDRIRQHVPKFILDNAPRIVGLLKFTGAFCMTRGQKGYFAACGYGLMLGNAMLFAFGGKKTAEQKEALQSKNEESEKKGPILGHIAKVLQPWNYPYESAATVYTAGSALWVIGGMKDKDGGVGRTISGLASLASDANAAFAKEKIGASYKNPHEKGSLKYYFTEMKSRPVLVSSALNFICDIAGVITGIRHWMQEGRLNRDFYACSIMLIANLFQGIFVNKNEYSLEKTGDEMAKDKKPEIAGKTAGDTKEENTSRQWAATTQLHEFGLARLRA